MARVRMLEFISGGRHDGRNWPPKNTEIDVPDWEAEDLIRARLAVPAGSGGTGDSDPLAPQAEAPAGTEPAAGAHAAPVAPPHVSPVTEVSPVAEVGGVPAAEPDVEGGLPHPHDIKQRWIDYAIAQGEDPAIARDMTKVDLMSKYGGRL